MTKKFLVTTMVLSLLIGGITFTCSNAYADTLSPKVQQLVTAINQNNHSSAEDTLKTLTSKEKDEFINYINTNEAKVPPLYYIKMADYILKTDKDLAAKWYYIGKVRAYEDVMMCKDKTAQSQLDILQYFAPKTVKYLFSRNKDKSYMAGLLQSVLDWDIAHQDRINPIWACYQGISAATKTPELKSETQRQKAVENVRDELKESILKYQKL